MEHKQSNIEGLHPVARAYSSQHRYNERVRRLRAIQAFLDRLQTPLRALLVLAVVFYCWVMVIQWDQEAFVAAIDDSLRIAVEQSEFRPYFTSEKHCRAPRQGEVLIMQPANSTEPGQGYRCSYVTNTGYGSAPRYAPPFYSRGLKSGKETS